MSGKGEEGSRLSKIFGLGCCDSAFKKDDSKSRPLRVLSEVLSIPTSIDSYSTGMPLPLNLYTLRDGPTAGGVDGSRSSRLLSSRSMSLSEHKDGVGASAKDPDWHVMPVVVALECGAYEQDKKAVPSVGRLEESELEPAAKLECVVEICKRRLGGGSEEDGHPSSRQRK